MNRFKIQSIKWKLTALVAVTCTVALLIACVAFVINDVALTRQSKVKQLTASAELVASNSTAALSFEQSEAAEELLSSLSKISTIRYAQLLTSEGESLASYCTENLEGMDEINIQMKPGHRFTDEGFLEIMVPVVEEEEILGTFFLQASMDDLRKRVVRNIWIAGTIMALCLCVAMAITFQLQKVVSGPILNLATFATEVSTDGDYSRRVESNSSGEMDTLYQCFNRMLEEIEKGQKSLEDGRHQLEIRVTDRTKELSEANLKLRAEFEERERMNAHMVELSHRAGKAEIATGVLHNVGNVLNSINVSASLVAETLQLSRLPSLKKATELLNSQDDIADFLANSQRGRVLPEYLQKLGNVLQDEQDTATTELESLAKHLEHVKTIVSMQQSYAGVSAVKETISLNELLDDAEILIESSLAKHNVDVVRDFENIPKIKVEKQKLLQVLVNLLKNAKDAMTEGRSHDRLLTIKTRVTSDDRLHISFTDNGSGIATENVTKIFSHGFTTKSDGHGFGLHSCANAINEMKGNLTVHSDGPGFGATFLIDLPFLPQEVTV